MFKRALEAEGCCCCGRWGTRGNTTPSLHLQCKNNIQLVVPEHPHSPFMMMVLLNWLGSGSGVGLV
jgi:hypothetical protein